MKNRKRRTVLFEKRELHMASAWYLQKSHGVFGFVIAHVSPGSSNEDIDFFIEKRQNSRRACGAKDILMSTFGKRNLNIYPMIQQSHSEPFR